jgi:long-chain acyl-CoA synthetase
MLLIDQITRSREENGALSTKTNDDENETMSRQRTDYIYLKQADTLAGVFLERIARSPDKTAYVQYDDARNTWQETSWAEIGVKVARWQAAFQREDLQAGDRVAIMLRNSIEWITFDLAAQCQGLVTVPLYTNDRPENIGYILQDAGVQLLLLENNEQWQTLQAIRNQLAGLKRIVTLHRVDPLGLQPRLAHLDDWLPEQGLSEPLPIEVRSEALATIVYTSGTTGRAKGVMLSHRNILWDIESGLKLIDIYPSDSFLSFLPLSHTLERTVGFIMPMVAGSSVAFARSIPQLGEDLQTLKPTVLISVPRIYERVYAKIQEKLAHESNIARSLFNAAVETGWQRFEHGQGRRPWSPRLALWPLFDKLVAGKIQEKLGGKLRVAVSGGAPLAPDIAKVFIGLGVPILQGYGLTESSPIVTANPHGNNIPASVGIPFPDIEFKITEAEELLVRAPNVMLGYWNNRQATAEVIDSEGWLHTGDKVKYEDGHIFITGRLKEIIVMANGEKVPPADMEMCITMDRLFDQALIIGEGKPYLSVLLVLNEKVAGELGIDPAQLTEEQQQLLLQRINKQLDNFPGYARIVRFSVATEPWSIENGLMTPTMKLKRKPILERYTKELEQLYTGH